MPHTPTTSLLRTTLLVGTVLVGLSLSAQSSAAMDRLSDDLCGCIQTLDPRASDVQLDAGVRHCLEDAVVYHPGTVHALIERGHGEGTKAFNLGRALGSLLERDCEAFQVIKVRLQQLQGAGSLKKGTT
jgi:hypothetical protein